MMMMVCGVLVGNKLVMRSIKLFFFCSSSQLSLLTETHTHTHTHARTGELL